MEDRISRRTFIKGSIGGIGGLAFLNCGSVWPFSDLLESRHSVEDRRLRLVLIHLAGGNDGWNTVIPYEDALYYDLRPGLAIRQKEVIPLADNVGLHGSCAGMADLYRAGQLCIINGVGRERSSPSHARALEMWESAEESGIHGGQGWISRYLNVANDRPAQSDSNLAIYFTENLPLAIRGDRRRLSRSDTSVPGSEFSESGRKYRPQIVYPSSHLGATLQAVGGIINSHRKARIFYLRHHGYDTHTDQLRRHAHLLSDLSAALYAFQSDLIQQQLEQEVLTIVYSEFGRSLIENSRGGTEHGTLGPVIVMGASLRKSLLGSPTIRRDPYQQELIPEFDFREVYATILRRGLGCDPKSVLGRRFEELNFV